MYIISIVINFNIIVWKGLNFLIKEDKGVVRVTPWGSKGGGGALCGGFLNVIRYLKIVQIFIRKVKV